MIFVRQFHSLNEVPWVIPRAVYTGIHHFAFNLLRSQSTT
jgi:hypothetical protein